LFLSMLPFLIKEKYKQWKWG